MRAEDFKSPAQREAEKAAYAAASAAYGKAVEAIEKKKWRVTTGPKGAVWYHHPKGLLAISAFSNAWGGEAKIALPYGEFMLEPSEVAAWLKS